MSSKKRILLCVCRMARSYHRLVLSCAFCHDTTFIPIIPIASFELRPMAKICQIVLSIFFSTLSILQHGANALDYARAEFHDDAQCFSYDTPTVVCVCITSCFHCCGLDYFVSILQYAWVLLYLHCYSIPLFILLRV